MFTLTTLCESLRPNYDRLLHTLRDLPDNFFNQPGVLGAWSIKNVIAHLTSWEELAARFLPERLATGRTPATLLAINADEHAWNAQQVALREHLTPLEQLEAFERTRQALLQMLRDLGEDMLNQPQPWLEWPGTLAEFILQDIGGHEREHGDAILAAVQRWRRT